MVAPIGFEPMSPVPKTGRIDRLPHGAMFVNRPAFPPEKPKELKGDESLFDPHFSFLSWVSRYVCRDTPSEGKSRRGSRGGITPSPSSFGFFSGDGAVDSDGADGI